MDTLDARNLLKCNIFRIARPLHLKLYIAAPKSMQAIIHLPNKVHSLIKPPLLHGTLKEKMIDIARRAFVSTFAKYKLFSTDPQFAEKEFLRDAKKAYTLFLHSLANNNVQTIKNITTCTLFRVNGIVLFTGHDESTGNATKSQAYHDSG